MSTTPVVRATGASAAPSRPATCACGGIELTGALARHFGSLSAPGLAAVTLEPGEPRPSLGEVLWELDAVPPDPTAAPQHQRLRRAGDRHVLDIDGEAVLEVAPDAHCVVHRHEAHAGAQLVAAVAIPLLAYGAGAHVVHASASVIGGEATLVVGASGVGKSSLLVGLAEAGAAPLSEDACVIGRAGGDLVVWPGPPWVRLELGAGLPDRWGALFEATDKRGWSLPGQPTMPAPLGRVVLLEQPGSDATSWAPLAAEQAVARLVPHVTWLGAPGERRAAAFRTAAALARHVPVWSLRLAWQAAWTDEAVAVLLS